RSAAARVRQQHGVLCSIAGTRRRGGDPDVRILRSGCRPRRRVESLGALRLLQARRDARRSDPATGGAARLVVVLGAVHVVVDGADLSWYEWLTSGVGTRQNVD